MESAKVIAGLTRIVRDVGMAEDLAQDALVSALEQWPASGIPRNPAAWLMAAAKHRAIDHFRRHKMLERKHQEIGHELETRQDAIPDFDTGLDDTVGDDVLSLIFIACHPVLTTEARVALTLRLLGGLTTEEIARAFLIAEPTIAQRIVRAKRTLADAKVPFEVPRGAELAERLASVLEVVYLIFNEGYSATAGDDWMRPALCDDALRLGRILAALAPSEPEVHGLVALMEIQASRAAARTSSSGQPILLLDQDRARWDQLLIQRGLAALDRAQRLGGVRGPYCVQASIAACHARARVADQTDWAAIVALYDELARLMPSPVVELSPPAQRARRPAREAWPVRRSATRVRARGVADPQCAGARSAARTGARCRTSRARLTELSLARVEHHLDVHDRCAVDGFHRPDAQLMPGDLPHRHAMETKRVGPVR
jgi:RNA polymerase sigma-70 factor (ECF subfamily)